MDSFAYVDFNYGDQNPLAYFFADRPDYISKRCNVICFSSFRGYRRLFLNLPNTYWVSSHKWAVFLRLGFKFRFRIWFWLRFKPGVVIFQDNLIAKQQDFGCFQKQLESIGLG